MSDCLPYQEIPYFNTLISDYLNRKDDTAVFYNHFPSLENFESQLKEKALNFSNESRKVLVTELLYQYENCQASEKAHKQIRSLSDIDTFTITTGHQLNIFTGPIYFIYKILTCIKLCHQLKYHYPDKHFVPVYWMATEDHDLEEIQFFNWENQKLIWQTNQTGAVGRMHTEGFEELFDVFEKELGIGDRANDLRKFFQKAYVFHDNLADATRFLVNELFKDYGLVIIDGDSKALKNSFVPYVEAELLANPSFTFCSKTAKKLEANAYPIQVNPRELNLFYLNENSRNRIIRKENRFYIKDTSLKFSEDEMIKELHQHPERFSPNVLTRPLYQEVVLPNLAYVGGAGELTYWLQLKTYFASQQVTFPMLILRNSALLVTKKQAKKLANLQLTWNDFFQTKTTIERKLVAKFSSIPIDFTQQKEHLQKQFENLYLLAEKTDKSFIGAVAAQEKKQKNGLDHLEKRLLKAQKRKLSTTLENAEKLHKELFPKATLQERHLNFGEAYLASSKNLIPYLLERFEPLQFQFDIVVID